MARTKLMYSQPSRDPTATPPTLSNELYADLFNPLCFVYPVTSATDDDTLIIVPGGRYPYDGDTSKDAEWAHEPEVELVWKNVLAYEKMDGPNPEMQWTRIVRYKCKDAATAFPLLEKPEGGPLDRFWHAHRERMYPVNNNNISEFSELTGSGSHVLATHYLPLIYRWALQVLSALSVIHNHEIIHMDIVSPDSFWLRQDLSLALVGFQSADFVNAQGQRVQGDTHCGEHFRFGASNPQRRRPPTPKHDLFDWGTLVYKFMTGRHPLDSRTSGSVVDLDKTIRTGTLPSL